MPWVAAAAVVGSGIASSRASKSASKSAERGAERSGAQIERAADRARADVLDFFPTAQQDLLAGAGAAGDLLAGGIGEQQRLLSAGNVGAQGTLQGGFGQVQNALLGLPVDQQAFAPQEIALSQLPQNPLAQQVVQAGQPQQPAQGLFANIADVQPSAERESVTSIKSNADVFDRIISGELSFPGVNPDAIAGIAREAGSAPSQTNIISVLAQRNDPEEIEAHLKATGFNEANQALMGALIRGLVKIREGI